MSILMMTLLDVYYVTSGGVLEKSVLQAYACI